MTVPGTSTVAPTFYVWMSAPGLGGTYVPATAADITDAMFRAGEGVLHGTYGPPTHEEEYADLVGEILEAVFGAALGGDAQ